MGPWIWPVSLDSGVLALRPIAFSSLMAGTWKDPPDGASYFSSILADCCILVSQFNNVFITFVRRSGNMIAYFLARHAFYHLMNIFGFFKKKTPRLRFLLL